MRIVKTPKKTEAMEAIEEYGGSSLEFAKWVFLESVIDQVLNKRQIITIFFPMQFEFSFTKFLSFYLFLTETLQAIESENLTHHSYKPPVLVGHMSHKYIN